MISSEKEADRKDVSGASEAKGMGHHIRRYFSGLMAWVAKGHKGQPICRE